MASIRQALDRLKGMRRVEWMILALAAAALVLAAGRGGEEAGSSLEKRMESVLSSVRGAGRVRVLVGGGEGALLSGEGAPGRGVVVVAEGAEDVKVALEITRAVQALTGLEAGRIEILPMGSD